jgi:hypothetical protein
MLKQMSAVRADPLPAVRTDPLPAVRTDPLPAVRDDPLPAVRTDPLLAVRTDPLPTLCVDSLAIIMYVSPGSYVALANSCKILHAYFDKSRMMRHFTTVRYDADRSLIERRLPCGWLHCEDDVPSQVYKNNGLILYYKYNKLHRTEGPAYISTVLKIQCWYYGGMLHREDGRPAVVWEDGTECDYYRHGVRYVPPARPTKRQRIA